MKIVSKYKDYYDYLSGIWGSDPKITLDRREFEHPEFFSHHPEQIRLYICGKIVEGFWDGENFYFGESLKKFGKINDPRKHHWFFNPDREEGRYVTFHFRGNYQFAPNNNYDIFVDAIDDPKKVNLKQNCPILMVNRYGRDKYYKFPILSKLNVGSVLAPEVIYQMLVDWLSDRNTDAENRPDTRNDVEKLLSKGFDKKQSFRPKIKT